MFLSMVIGQCLEVPSKTILKSCSWNLVWYFLMNPSIFYLQQFVLKTNNFPFPAGLAWLTISVTHKTLNIKHWTLPDWSSYLPNGQCPLNIRNQSSYLAWLIILAAQTKGRNHLFAVVTPSNCLKCSSSSWNDNLWSQFHNLSQAERFSPIIATEYHYDHQVIWLITSSRSRWFILHHSSPITIVDSITITNHDTITTVNITM